MKRDNTIADIVAIEEVSVAAYTIPCNEPESDGTIAWQSTTMLVVHITGGGKKGLGYTYADAAVAYFIQHTLKKELTGKNAMSPSAVTDALVAFIRNQGQCGIAMMAISAIDIALWDLKCRILNIPLSTLLGRQTDKILIYGSGGFTSYSLEKIKEQLSGWVNIDGLKQVKIKIGLHPNEDISRVSAAREAIGNNTDLFVDANGGYNIKQALSFAKVFTDYNVIWFEEPVAQHDWEGLKFIRNHAPAQMNIVAGEYGYNLTDFQQLLKPGSLDIMQADATRCGGITGFIRAAALCHAYRLPFSSHCAPSAHLQAAMCVPGFYTAEYFHDHVRIEKMLLDGFTAPIDGHLKPDNERPGLGFDFKFNDAEKFKI